MVISDNGASSEGGPSGSVNENKFFNNVPDSLEENLQKIDELGGPTTFNHYAWGWTFAGNTPFRRWKRETYRGGISDPFIVHWPKGIKAKGEIRTQYAHAIDMVPTVLDALGIEPPTSIKGVTQSPIEGVSFAHAFNDAKAPIEAHHPVLRDDGPSLDLPRRLARGLPVAGTLVHGSGQILRRADRKDKLTELDAKGWELYHVDQDFAENHNVAAENRAKLIEMIATWYVEAGKYNVLPIDSRGVARFAEERPQIAVARTSYTYYPGTQTVPINAGRQCAQSATQHHRGCRDPQRRRRRRAALGRRCPGRLYASMSRTASSTMSTTTSAATSFTSSRMCRSGGTPPAALRVRGDRQARHRARQGRAGPRPALHRWQAGRTGRHSAHDAARPRSGRRHRLRRRFRRAGLGPSTSRRSSSPARSTAPRWM